MPLTVPEAILHRRSVKAFKPDAIPADVLKQVINLTLAAPSSWNFQPWRIVVIDDAAQKEALAEVAWRQKQITQAPVTFVYAVKINGWADTMSDVIRQAAETGAWPEKFGAFIAANAPGFQISLGERLREYAIKDAIIAATHTALAAESLGLGSCFMNGWDEEGVKKVIGAEGDPDIAIALVLPVGYALQTPLDPGRLPENMTVFQNKLG